MAPQDPASTPGLPARRIAAEIIDNVLRRRRPLDEQFEGKSAHPGLASLPERDRALTRRIVATILRRLGTLRHLITAFVDRGLPKDAPMVENALLVGAAQILFLDVPDHAAVDLSVRLVQSDHADLGSTRDRPSNKPKSAKADLGAARYAGLVNAVLRRVAREGQLKLAGLDTLALDTPQWLLARWTRTYGADLARAIAAASNHEAPLDLSVKSDPETWAARLGGQVLPTGSVRLARFQAEWAPVSRPESALTMDSRARTADKFTQSAQGLIAPAKPVPPFAERALPHGPVSALPGYDEGEWWVQDAAAALPAHLFGDVRGMTIADLCAAPGGKTVQLANAGARVTAVDRSEARLARVRENMARLHLAVEIVAADAAQWQGGTFDAVLLDAPCSSTGTIRRHPDIPWLKTESDLPPLIALQRRLLDNAVALTKPGGTLVYCTCSLEPEEGEDAVAELLARRNDVRRRPVAPTEVFGLGELLNAAGDLRTLPCHLAQTDSRPGGMDGFYAARLTRLEAPD